jgi:membrane protease subunit (stomatin/prohibitin family)
MSVCAFEFLQQISKTKPSFEIRMFAKKGVPALRSFAKTAYEEFGVRMVILAGYQLEPGEPIISLCVFIFFHVHI